jgi:hypothetical protein
MASKSRSMGRALLLVGLALAAGRFEARAATALLGPIPYLDAVNSPLTVTAPDFVLEDFEDGVLSPLGVSVSPGAPLAPGTDTDSVDGDDGLVDGWGRDGHSFFATDGPLGVTIQFDALALGGLPREAGVVWTDGAGEATFEAFDAAGISLGVVGPVAVGDGATDGTTPEDRFFGVVHDGGVSALRIANTAGGIEIDHVQFGSVNRPPDCSQAYGTPSVFWPPNHRFASVSVRGVTDPDGDPVIITVTGIGQDEPVDAPGSGATCPDGQGVGTDVAWVRVERAGPGDGRVYTIDFLAEDGRGGACTGAVTVCVPHDQGHGDVCGDQGALADSTGLVCPTACEDGDCVPDECDGTRVPRGLLRRMGKAGRQLDAAASRGNVAPARRAVVTLAKAERKLAKLADRDELPDPCVDAVAGRLHAAARRAERWLAARGR